MRISQSLFPITKEKPAGATIKSHILMEQAGMIAKLSSGLYHWLPLGMRVLNKVSNIIRQELNAIGCQEVLNPIIQPAEIWQQSGRYDDYGAEMLRFTDRHQNNLLFSPTNEEAMTDIIRRYVKSYRQLPQIIYQLQWKFRDEIRPRFGVMRAREFLMQDAYSFDADEDAAKATYFQMFHCYLNIFRRLGLTVLPLKAETGPIGGELSHEFHVITDEGESGVFYQPELLALAESGQLTVNNYQEYYAATDDVHHPATCPVPAEALKQGRGIEVGQIFYFGDKYSKPLKANFDHPEHGKAAMTMGSYGIGVSRLIGAAIEANATKNAIYWPAAMAPFDISLINLKPQDRELTEICNKLYADLQQQRLEVIYDDSNLSVGNKFACNELIGSPLQIIVSKRGIADKVVEIKHHQREKIVKKLYLDQVVSYCIENVKSF